jgi:hypothetical protein
MWRQTHADIKLNEANQRNLGDIDDVPPAAASCWNQSCCVRLIWLPSGSLM